MSELVRRISLQGGDKNLEPLLTREWLVTNGLGGYASGTLAGVITRRYHGFLIAALFGLVRTLFSRYRKLRTELGLSHYSEREMLGLLQAAGFSARRLERNFGHNQQRMAFAAVKPA